MPRIIIPTLLGILFIAACGSDSTNKSVQASSFGSSPGFGCAISFGSTVANADEEFSITITPNGKYLGAPTLGATPAGVTITSNTKDGDVVKVKAKAKFSFTLIASVTDSRGRHTQCANGMQIKEAK